LAALAALRKLESIKIARRWRDRLARCIRFTLRAIVRRHTPHDTTRSGLPCGRLSVLPASASLQEGQHQTPAGARYEQSLDCALATLRGKAGMWPENDPEAYPLICAICWMTRACGERGRMTYRSIIPTLACGWIVVSPRA
jgi:hypothetical protein